MITGWRVYNVVGTGDFLWLESLGGEPFNPNVPAQCREGSECFEVQRKLTLIPGDVPDPSPCPHEALVMPACGYYAHLGWPTPDDVARNLVRIHPFLGSPPNNVLALVEGYGIVREHESGFRSQYMKISRIYGKDAAALKRIAERYECEWEDVSTWKLESKNEPASAFPNMIAAYSTLGLAGFPSLPSLPNAWTNQLGMAQPESEKRPLRVKTGFLRKVWHEQEWHGSPYANCGEFIPARKYETSEDADVTCGECKRYGATS